jgi:hypothetical protein
LYSLFIFFSNSLLCFKLPHILSFLSLFCFLSFYSLRPLFLFRPLFVLALVVFIGQRERGRPYCRPIAAHREQGFTALPRHRVSWPMGVASRARLPGFPS